MIVLDTNIALDLLLFADPASQPLRQLLASRQKQWVATVPMRDELARVLDYPLLAARLLKQQQTITLDIHKCIMQQSNSSPHGALSPAKLGQLMSISSKPPHWQQHAQMQNRCYPKLGNHLHGPQTMNSEHCSKL